MSFIFFPTLRRAVAVITVTFILPLFYSATSAAQTLLITEIGNNSFYTDLSGTRQDQVPVWLEVTNQSSSSVDISQFSLRSTAATVDGTPLESETFELPTQVLEPGKYLVIRGRVPDESKNNFEASDQIIFIQNANKAYPNWNTSGFIELSNNSGVIDFVRFGNSNEQPTDQNHWEGSASATALPYGENKFGFGLGRDVANTDSNSPQDWTLRKFATFAGPNDVNCDEDDDLDGLPDCSELPGSSFAGLPLAEWGAKPGRRDIFVEVDYMVRDPSAGPGPLDDPGIIPQRLALLGVTTAFARQNIAIHFDVGDLFHQADGISLENFDLGGGNPTPLKNGVVFGERSNMNNLANVYGYKRRYMDCLLYTSPSPRDGLLSRMPSSA